MDNTIEALQDLYDIIEKCERRNVKLPEDVIRQINEAEENIIRDEILPIIGKDIEPTLSQIKRDLVLVVEAFQLKRMVTRSVTLWVPTRV